MEILRKGAFSHKLNKPKKFECEWCGCIWVAENGEYKHDWSKHSIPTYMKCPCCSCVMYSLDSFQGYKSRERKD